MQTSSILKKNYTHCLLLSAYCLLFSFLLSSCDPHRVFEKNIELPDYTWDIKNKPTFEVKVEDTVALHNFYVNIRHASHYPYANLYLFVQIQFPNGKKSKDTLECIFADPTGKWKGEGMGDIWDNSILWKSNVKFPLKGNYIFEYEQAMRTTQVPFVMDVGLRVEKAERKTK
jgi:gliding motility-associated lipoprotein GldH